MKEELTNLVNKYSCSKSENDYRKIIEAIEKYDRYIFRLNLESQRYFDMLMDKTYGKAEIIEEDKPIEEINITYQDNHNQEEINEYLRCSLNEIIKAVNKLNERGKEE